MSIQPNQSRVYFGERNIYLMQKNFDERASASDRQYQVIEIPPGEVVDEQALEKGGWVQMEPKGPVSSAKVPQKIGSIWHDLRKSINSSEKPEESPRVLADLEKLGVVESDVRAHKILVPLVKRVCNERVKIVPRDTDTGIYYVSIEGDKKPIGVIKTGIMSGSYEALVRSTVVKLNPDKGDGKPTLSDHVLPGVMVAIAHPEFPTQRNSNDSMPFAVEKFSGDEDRYEKFDGDKSYTQLVEEQNEGLDFPPTMVGMFKPFVTSEQLDGSKVSSSMSALKNQMSVAELARLTCSVIICGIQDVDIDAIIGKWLIDVAQSFPPEVIPEGDLNHRLPSTDLAYLDNHPLAREPIPREVLVELHNIVNNPGNIYRLLGELSEQRILFSDQESHPSSEEDTINKMHLEMELSKLIKQIRQEIGSEIGKRQPVRSVNNLTELMQLNTEDTETTIMNLEDLIKEYHKLKDEFAYDLQKSLNIKNRKTEFDLKKLISIFESKTGQKKLFNFDQVDRLIELYYDMTSNWNQEGCYVRTVEGPVDPVKQRYHKKGLMLTRDQYEACQQRTNSLRSFLDEHLSEENMELPNCQDIALEIDPFCKAFATRVSNSSRERASWSPFGAVRNTPSYFGIKLSPKEQGEIRQEFARRSPTPSKFTDQRFDFDADGFRRPSTSVSSEEEMRKFFNDHQSRTPSGTFETPRSIHEGKEEE